ncbi:DUF4231 domain-containing protein [Gemella cuniculi]|uniref:DUF4231 domain-containing protein n=1 Tax=Gemella cuniculi TaxID=150240 RepID=UPI000409E46E|nr:DUF4231 domain-containing protein [Gemella cuniculi]
MQLSEQEYIEKRVNAQIEIFTKKSIQHRRRYKVLKITEILSGFLIAVCCAIPMESNKYRVLSVCLASLGLLCEGIISLYNAKEHWISYQHTVQLLEKEKYLYKGKAEKYENKKNSLTIFISSCEAIISEEINNWKVIQSKEIKVPTPKETNVAL